MVVYPRLAALVRGLRPCERDPPFAWDQTAGAGIQLECQRPCASSRAEEQDGSALVLRTFVLYCGTSRDKSRAA